MINQLSPKDIRTLKLGAVCVAGIIIFLIGSEVLGRLKKAQDSTDILNKKLDLIDVDKAKQAGIMAIVPKFEMPIEEEDQKFLFLDKLTEQFKKAGIKNQPLEVASKTTSKKDGYQLLRLKCSATCRLTQALDFLANLKDNPYLVGIEELRLRVDKKKPQEVAMDLTVSTFVK
ncbi:MAG: hypothetical protein GY845_27985 [Planctomycetes bacterium]|nr:hypothetical protein [Planctomycetota bacterium]